jgi:hypothetical protein
MAIPVARFKDLCMDANDPAGLGAFWAVVLDRAWNAQGNGDGLLTGATPEHTIWINAVPEEKNVKHRVHLDIYATDLASLETLGAALIEPQHGDRTWTVLGDPDGSEFCAFLRPTLPAERLHGLVVDSADPGALARWWGEIFGTAVTENGGRYTLVDVPGMPISSMDFVPVPEPKTVKNRIHWDVTAPEVTALLQAGAALLREPDDDIDWHILADPEGNEFCAFGK